MCFPLKPFKIERDWIGPGGLRCVVVQTREASSRCGYVRVPSNHPFNGLHYDSIDVSVHGGLTFANEEYCRLHKDGPGWWLGFDCCHYTDAMYDPNVDIDKVSELTRQVLFIHWSVRESVHARMAQLFENVKEMERGEHFWTHDEVVAETEYLAVQLAYEADFKPRMRRIANRIKESFLDAIRPALV